MFPIDRSIKTDGGTTLLPSRQSERLAENLLSLIAHSIEGFTKARGQSLSLVGLRSAYSENNADLYYSLYNVLVKDQEANENMPIRVLFAVAKGDYECFPQ